MSTHALHDQKGISSFGFWVYIMSDCLLFATLFATFAVLRNNTAFGPSPEELFSLPFVLLETVILLTSSFTCGLALIAGSRRSKNAAILFLAVTALLGALFVTLELTEFSHMLHDGAGWQRSAFLSAFFTLVGTHGLHVSIGLVWVLLIIGYLSAKGFTEKFDRQLACFTLFWHFLDIIWIFIFSFVYLLPLVV